MDGVSYKPLIHDMTWSYSRLTTFDICKYKWYLQYIKYPRVKRERLFFSAYGSFMHELIADFLRGKKSKYDCIADFLAKYDVVLPRDAPWKVYEAYYKQGMEYLKNLQEPQNVILEIESKYKFDIDGMKFIGIIDRVELDEDGNLVIVDNKSKALKKRTKKSVKSNQILDDYLKQLYIYSIPVKNRYGKLPIKLAFDCFRTQTYIEEPFNMDAFESAKEWAKKKAQEIEEETEFSPTVEPFVCQNICDMHDYCPYFNVGRNEAF